MNNFNRAIKQSTITLLLLMVCLYANAQYALLKSADQQFNAFNFVKAIELYQEAYTKNQDLSTIEHLAESYYNIRDYRNAEIWYEKAAQHDEAKPESILRYAEVLQNNTKFREAKAQYERYSTINPDFDQADLEQAYASCDSAMFWIEHPLKSVEVKNEQKLNSAQADFGATSGPLGLTFVSDRFDGAAHPDIIYGWTGNPFLSMYTWEDDSLSKISMNGKGNNHFGPPTFTPDGQEMIFSLTRTPDKNEKKMAKKQLTVNIEIFTAKVSDPNWVDNAVPFRYNNITEWSVGDPFLSAEGDTLYFTSNMPDGFGGTDIYYVTQVDNGSWSEAVNLGEAINTNGNERFPAQDATGEFYFSSDGHIGMGGLDVYKVVGDQGQIVNLGYPFNSSKDDFSIRFVKGMEGYMASNRQGGSGTDDIYSFNLDKKIQISLEGGVFNEKTRLPVSGARVVLTPNGDESDAVEINADETGRFRFNLKEETAYHLLAEQFGFKEPGTVDFNTRGMDSSIVIHKDIYLRPVEVKEIIVMNNIYFDFDKADIRPDAALELEKVLSFLNSAPTTKIELSAHTDSRGSAEYNNKLSQRRADSAIAYLVSRGISADRLTAKGYGFTRLVNRCGKGVECTEEEHQQNRRVEFVILSE